AEIASVLARERHAACGNRLKQRVALVRGRPQSHRADARSACSCNRVLDQAGLQQGCALGAERRNEPSFSEARQRRLGEHCARNWVIQSLIAARALLDLHRKNMRAAATTSGPLW